MGAYLSQPMTEKVSEEGGNHHVRYAATAMQGWRVHQEDAHNCILDFDEECSLFAVYDGHGGREVSTYASLHLPEVLKSREFWTTGDYRRCLKDAFLHFDDTLRSSEVLKELRAIADRPMNEEMPQSDDDVEDKEKLYLEASLPLDVILSKYGIENWKGRNGRSILLSSNQVDDLNSHSDEVSEDVYNSELRNSTVLLRNGEHVPSCEENEEVKRGDSSPESHCTSGSESNDENQIVDADTTSENSVETVRKRRKEVQADVSLKRWKKSESLASLQSQSPKCLKESESSDEFETEKKGDIIADKTSMVETKVEDSEQSIDESKSSVAAENGQSSTIETTNVENSESEQSADDDYYGEEEVSEDEDEESDQEESMTMYGTSTNDTPGEDSGTTACLMLLFKDRVIVGNVGDSRAVLCRNGCAVELSVDHKPEDEIERKRIEAAGGEISADGRVNGGLNLSRALGDHFYKKNETLPLAEQMISSNPDVTEHELRPGDEFVIVACDGIWNSLSSQEAVEFVRERMAENISLKEICEQMCEECLSSDTRGDGTGCDNMTIIIAQLL